MNVTDTIKPFEYLKDMYIDGCFHNFLVDKVKAELVKVVEIFGTGKSRYRRNSSKA
ncbi:hypothetical protein GCM10010918_29320 [Paenibacillus radicis (ex Gao et al. 2016)]|uniref:Uncharacterized protein n=1 Tax=Paenibacillus radicis (ex Gao et al. 2016) TaxID=1737354 RepID=A0A917HAJ0_9BACL|nr:hypothetical protein GCM10010918_29320 [Paenibacillus radicis (ex Gao et al. 2016)]